MGLGFLSPWFLAGAVAVGVPLVLHLLRQRADPVQPFSAVHLLQRSRVEQARRRRLRDILLFALRAAAVVLLALAFARPYLIGAAPVDKPVTVVLADVSGSLSDTTRTGRLRDLVSSAITNAPSSDRVALVQFGSQAEVVVAPTTDRAAAIAAAKRLTPGFSATSYHAAFAKAAEILARPGGHAVVVTDLQASGWNDADATPGINGAVDVLDVGAPPADVGVEGVAADENGSVTARFRGTGSSRQVEARFEVNGALVTTAVSPLTTAGTGAVSTALALKAGDVLRVSVADPSGLAADDERWFVARGHALPNVLVVTAPGATNRDALYVQRALQALDGSKAVAVSLEGADRLQSEGVPSSTAVIVLLGTSGLDRRGMDALAGFVRGGGGLVLAAGPAVTPELIVAGFGDELPRLRARGAPAAALSMMPADTRHPALAAFAERAGAFAGARFARAAELTGTEKTTIVARFDNGDPAIAAAEYGKGRAVVLASDLGNRWNDLPLQPAFVPLVGEAVAWASGSSVSPAPITIGESPLAGTDRPGTVVLSATSHRPVARVAVNADPREFDLSRMSRADFLARIVRNQEGGADDVRISARREESSRGLWRYALAMLLAVLVAESALGRRP